jgi:hypothetical protein
MAPNFSRCVATFGSSWSEPPPCNTTFSPSPLALPAEECRRTRRCSELAALAAELDLRVRIPIRSLLIVTQVAAELA